MHYVQVMFQKILQLIIWQETGLKEVIKFFSAVFSSIDTKATLDIHKYLMERT